MNTYLNQLDVEKILGIIDNTYYFSIFNPKCIVIIKRPAMSENFDTQFLILLLGTYLQEK